MTARAALRTNARSVRSSSIERTRRRLSEKGLRPSLWRGLGGAGFILTGE